MDALEAVTSRRGVFKFKPAPVEPEKLDAVLRAAGNAPTPANLQPWAFVAVTEPELARRVAGYLVRTQADCVYKALLGMPDDVTRRRMEAYEGLENAPCFVLFCLQPKVQFALPEHQALLREWYLVSVGAALASLMAAAAALGLGTRLFGGFGIEQHGQGLKELLGIPAGIDLVIATPLGYYEEEETRLPPVQDPTALAAFRRGAAETLPGLFRGRLPLDTLVHMNGW
jgi:iodotyrosine deiodinase